MEDEVPVEVTVPGEAIVIRFRPTAAEAVLRSAEKTFRARGNYRLSVFAAVKMSDEPVEKTHERLLVAAQLSTIQKSGNKKFYVCTAASELYNQRFSFWKDGYQGEVEEHYSVDIGNPPDLAAVEKFLEAFTETEEW